jgi:hypothetical protein
VLIESKEIKDFESILNEMASQREGACLTMNDLAHAFYLMKVFVAYPKNYGGLLFESPSTESELRSRERDLVI